MIAKEPDKKYSQDRLLAAGLEAERQMHFYLARAFAHKEDVMVFGDLRFPAEKDACQIDHLVMHRWGLIIIESKSVSGEIEVNEHGEWARRFGNRAEGMPSPILQAGRQRDFLVDLLQQNRTQLRRKVLGLRQGRFLQCPVDLFVAISDRGRINRRGINPPELKKADQIPGDIEKIVERHRKGSGLLRLSLTSDDGLWDMNLDEMARVREFLLGLHRPKTGSPAMAGERPVALSPTGALTHEATTNRPIPPTEVPVGVGSADSRIAPSSVLACQHCASTDLRVLHGRGIHPYYLRCSQCGKSTQLTWVCSLCGGEARIRKRALEFTRWCTDPACGLEETIFTNPSDV